MSDFVTSYKINLIEPNLIDSINRQEFVVR